MNSPLCVVKKTHKAKLTLIIFFAKIIIIISSHSLTPENTMKIDTLKLSLLSNSKREMNLNQLRRGKNSPHLNMDDEIFNRIIREKTVFYKERQKKRLRDKQREAELEQRQLKLSQIEMSKLKKERETRAKEGLRKIERHKEERERNLKESLNYKFLKEHEPLYRKILKDQEVKEKEMEEFYRTKKPKNRSVPLEELMKHSKVFENKKNSKQIKR